MNSRIIGPELLKIPTINSDSGSIGVLEGNFPIPFDIKRIYYIYGVPEESVRGSHSHKLLHQFIFAPTGSFVLKLENHLKQFEFLLDKPEIGVYVPPGYWRTLTRFEERSVCVVAASDRYSESDYIRDYDEFMLWSTQNG